MYQLNFKVEKGERRREKGKEGSCVEEKQAKKRAEGKVKQDGRIKIRKSDQEHQVARYLQIRPVM